MAKIKDGAVPVIIGLVDAGLEEFDNQVFFNMKPKNWARALIEVIAILSVRKRGENKMAKAALYANTPLFIKTIRDNVYDHILGRTLPMQPPGTSLAARRRAENARRYGTRGMHGGRTIHVRRPGQRSFTTSAPGSRMTARSFGSSGGFGSSGIRRRTEFARSG